MLHYMRTRIHSSRRGVLTIVSTSVTCLLLTGFACQTRPSELLPTDEASADRCADSEAVAMVLENTIDADLTFATDRLSASGPFGCVSERDLMALIDSAESTEEDVRMLAFRRKLND